MKALDEIIFLNESKNDGALFGYSYIAAANDLSQNKIIPWIGEDIVLLEVFCKKRFDLDTSMIGKMLSDETKIE